MVNDTITEQPSSQTAAKQRLIGIVVALPEELATLTRRKCAEGKCLTLNDNILVTLAGTGPANAEKAANLLIDKGVNGLISWGCAAALSPQLKPGDLLIPEQILSEQQLTLNTDKRWQRHLQFLFSTKHQIITGMLVESSRIIADSSEKQNILRKTSAIALDMESAAVIKTAQQAGLPGIAIRAIADPATMTLPQAVIHALNDQGQVQLHKLLQFLARHPWEILALSKLGLHFNAACKTLRSISKQLDDISRF